MGNGVKVEVEHIDIVDLVLISYHILKLVNIAFIHSIRRYHISVSILEKCKYTFSFENGKIIIYYDSVMVGFGMLVDDLYKIHLPPSLTHCTSDTHVVNVVIGSKCGRINEKSSMLWHR